MVLRVAFQGAPGAFSHEAVLALAPGGEPVACPSFAALFDALESGRCDRAVAPVENSVAGPVPEVADRLRRPGLEVLDEAERRIEMALMALPGVGVSELRRALSHPMALKQCRRSLLALRLEPVEAFDTAGAAALVAQGGDRSAGALASRAAAGLHGLAILEPNMEDDGANRTRFLLLKRAGA